MVTCLIDVPWFPAILTIVSHVELLLEGASQESQVDFFRHVELKGYCIFN